VGIIFDGEVVTLPDARFDHGKTRLFVIGTLENRVVVVAYAERLENPRMPNKIEIKWLDEPEEHDYSAALSYLSLLYDEQAAATYVDKLKHASMSKFKAKDIFRASGLSLLGVSNAHVEKDQKKIQLEHELSPLLLIRDSAHGKVIIADGYHRLCAVYSYDEDAVIPCKII